MPGPSRTLAGDADRERVIGLLREHFAQGRLDAAELDRRVGAVLTAEFTDEIAATVADLPSVVRVGPPAGKTRRGHGHAVKPRPGWLPTDERFRDPTTKVVTRVWIDPADQSRHYIPEPD
ncbi:MAG TPA: DUF1707 domain-containing protein [Streptosporangiaceae bacterium]